jgi:hypothetical protein
LLWIGIADPDPDPTFRFDAHLDPDPYPTPSIIHVGKSEFFVTFIHSIGVLIVVLLDVRELIPIRRTVVANVHQN